MKPGPVLQLCRTEEYLCDALASRAFVLLCDWSTENGNLSERQHGPLDRALG